MNAKQQQTINLLKRWLPLVLAALPALIPPRLIIRDGVDMPNADQWAPSFADMYVKSHHGQLTLWDFTAQHNEHRIFVPKVAFFALNSLTHWNTKGEMVLAWLMACATSAGILWLCLRTTSRGAAVFLWFLSNLLIFTPTQWENWIWGLGVINLMPMFWITVAFVAVCSNLKDSVKIAIAIPAAAAATFSSGNGCIVWAIVTPMLLWSSSRKEFWDKKWVLIAWSIGFALTITFYVIGYKEPEHAPEMQSHFAGFLPTVQYILLFLINPFPIIGNMLSFMTFATLASLTMLVLLGAAAGYGVYVWFKYRDLELCRRILIWVCIAGYAVLSGAIASWFRARSGVGGAIASRYVSYAIYLPIALVNLVPIICANLSKHNTVPGGRFWIQVPAFFGCAIFLAALMSLAEGSRTARFIGIGRREGKVALQLLNILPDNPRLVSDVFGFPRDIIQKAQELSDMGYLRPPLIKTANVLELQDPYAPATRYGAMEQLAQNGDHLSVGGWAILPHRRKPADAVVLAYENENKQAIIFAMANIGVQREDVVATYDDSAYELCGWVANIPINALPPVPKNTRLTAWAMDAETGHAYRLEGEGPIQR